MIYLIEIWNAKQAWLDLSTEERGHYVQQIGTHIQKLLDAGVKVLTWSNNEAETSFRADFDYFAIWTFPNHDLANQFQELVEGAGWYNYFEQTNLMGQEDNAQNILGQLVNLQASNA